MLKRLVPTILLFIAGTTAAGENYHWRNITVGAGGFAPNIVFSRAEENLAYLRTDMGGAYRWEQSRQRWMPLQDGMAESSYFGIESIAADPGDADVVHMAAGMYKHYPAAMLRSFDRGRSWKVIRVPFAMGGNEDGRGLGERLAINPDNTDQLLFGSRFDGLWQSLDRGASWRKLDSFPHAGLGQPQERWSSRGGISFVLFTHGNIFAGVADRPAAGIYRSGDGGASWKRIAGGPQALLPVQAAAAGDRLYITYSDDIGPNGIHGGAVYKLDTDSGQWSDITPPPKGAEGGFMGLSASGQNPDVVAVATVDRWQPRDNIFVSRDGGESWRELASRSERDVSATPYLYWGNDEPDFGWWIAGLAFDPFDDHTLVYTTGATVYRTEKLAARKLPWRPWVAGIEQTAVITLTSLPQGPELLSGFGDISGFVHEDFDRSPRTMLTTPVFANTNNIDYAGAAPEIVVRSGTPPHRAEGPVPTLAWSADSGRHWQPLTVPPVSVNGKSRRYDLSGDDAITVSADGDTFVFMAPRPQRSVDRGRHWQAVKNLPVGLRPVADRVDGERFYALDFARGKIYASDDAARTFEPLNTQGLPAGMKAPKNREQAWPLLATPGRSGELWLVSDKGLFRSTDGGRNFRQLQSDIAVEEMAFGKAAPGRDHPALFAIGTRDGLRAIWRSDDADGNWQRINGADSEYGRRYRTLAGDPRHFGRVYVGTDGRGIVMGEPSQPSTASRQDKRTAAAGGSTQ
ncbi:sialidase family protein [Microbulbifer litoralis]|uniref:sialidase family protein n=1 Tax=Microbulbifer litoralis TaxID=2933965 RepID=UPI002027D3E3|nr:sialidase family protein [Microbulbifer sp. GX H0434]